MKKLILILTIAITVFSCNKDDDNAEATDENILNGRIVFSANNQVPNNLKVLSLDGIIEIEPNTILDLPTSENGLEFLLNGNDDIVFIRKTYPNISDNNLSSESTILFLCTYNTSYYRLNDLDKNTVSNQILNNSNFIIAKNILDDSTTIDLHNENFKQKITQIINEIFSEENLSSLNQPQMPLEELTSIYTAYDNTLSIKNNADIHVGFSITKDGNPLEFDLLEGQEQKDYNISEVNSTYHIKSMSGADIVGVFNDNDLEEIEAFNADFRKFLFDSTIILARLAVPNIDDVCFEIVFDYAIDGIVFAEEYGNNNEPPEVLVEAFLDVIPSISDLLIDGIECVGQNNTILEQIFEVLNIVNDIVNVANFLNDQLTTISQYIQFENYEYDCYYKVETVFYECDNPTVGAPYNPVPLNNSDNIPLSGSFSFQPGNNTPDYAAFRLYTGLSTDLTNYIITNSSYNLYSDLQEGTIYYWKIEVINPATNQVLQTSDIWNFTTITSSNNTIPTLTTNTITDITETTATSGGNVTDDGGNNVTSRGVCWSTSPNPTIVNSTTNDGTGTGSFNSSLTGLTENSTYYLRAYATNSEGTAYGNEEVFITNTSGGGIYDGNVTLATQVEVDIFGANNYTGITGVLFIGVTDDSPTESDIHDLSPLSSLNNVYYINVYNNLELLTLHGLHNISIIDEALSIYKNSITSLNGLNNLTNVNAFWIIQNSSLLSLDGLNSGLTNVNSLSVENNPNLISLEGLSNISSVLSVAWIKNNDSLLDLTGLENLMEIGSALRIEDNFSLESLNGIENINSIGNNFEITGNTVLSDFCSLQDYLASTDLIPYIVNNLYNPTKQDIIDGNCSL